MVGLAPQAAWPKKREACSDVSSEVVGAGVGEGDGEKSELPPPQAAKRDAGKAAHISLENNLGLLTTLAGGRGDVVRLVSSRCMPRTTVPIVVFNQ